MYCSKCGNQLNPESNFCSSCGSAKEVNNNQAQSTNQNSNMNMHQPQNQQITNDNLQTTQSPTQQEFGSPNQSMSNQEPNNMNQTPGNSNSNKKAFMIISYLGILWLISMLAENKDENVRFHVGQGIILTISTIALMIILNILNSTIIPNIFGTSYDLFGGIRIVNSTGVWVMRILNWITWLIILILSIVGIINANKNEKKPLPIIGNMAFYK